MDAEDINEITRVHGEHFLDGGSIILCAVTDVGEKRHICLNQHAWNEYDNPGRLVFNGALVGVRSDDAREIVNLLSNAGFKAIESDSIGQLWYTAVITDVELKELPTCPDDELRLKLRNSIVDFVESNAYVSISHNGVQNN